MKANFEIGYFFGASLRSADCEKRNLLDATSKINHDDKCLGGGLRPNWTTCCCTRRFWADQRSSCAIAQNVSKIARFVNSSCKCQPWLSHDGISIQKAHHTIDRCNDKGASEWHKNARIAPKSLVEQRTCQPVCTDVSIFLIATMSKSIETDLDLGSAVWGLKRCFFWGRPT